MENHSLRELTLHSYDLASQLAVVVVDGIDPNITLADLQGAVTGTGASGWDLHFDQKLLTSTLEVRFEEKERAESYITEFNRLVRSNMSFIIPPDCTETRYLIRHFD